jgi:hypothetical protein
MLLSRTMRITTTALISAGLMFGSVPAAANPACQAGILGCVLPVRDAAAPAAPAPIDTAPPAVAEAAGGGGAGWLLPAIAAIAAAVILYFLLNGGDDDEELPDSP